VPEERVPDAGGADGLLGGAVVPHECEGRVGAVGADEGRVDDALHARGRDGGDGGAVLVEAIDGLGGGHQVDGVRTLERRGEPGRVGVAARVGPHVDAGERHARRIPDDQPEVGVRVAGEQALGDAAAERSGGSCDRDHGGHACTRLSCGIMTPSNHVRPVTHSRRSPPCASAS
jgi:hypothetical protein